MKKIQEWLIGYNKIVGNKTNKNIKLLTEKLDSHV